MALPLLIQLLPTAIAAFSQFQTARAQSSSYNFESQMMKQRAEQENLQAREQALALKQKVQREIGAARAMFASRGINVGGSPSAINAYEQSLINESKDIDTLMFGAKQSSIGTNFKAQIQKLAGYQSHNAGMFGMASTLHNAMNKTSFGNINNKSLMYNGTGNTNL